MGKNKNKTLNIPIPTLTWKLICLIVFVILAFRLDTENIARLFQIIISHFSKN